MRPVSEEKSRQIMRGRNPPRSGLVQLGIMPRICGVRTDLVDYSVLLFKSGVALQIFSRERSTRKPLRFPSAPSARDSLVKKLRATRCISSGVTTSRC
jgi:hypothetical protein